MNQDRRINGWILVASIIGLIAGLSFVISGALTSIVGFVKPEQLFKIDFLSFFVMQEGFFELQENIFGSILEYKYLFLFLGIAIAVIGLIQLILSIISLNYAKKQKVVRRRVAIICFSVLPILIAVSAITYFVLEKELLIDDIKYIIYGIAGVFSIIVLFNILGVIFGRSEQFMSNDNSKYAFDNSSLRQARVNVNNSVNDAITQPNIYSRPNNQPINGTQLPIQQGASRPAMQRVQQRPQTLQTIRRQIPVVRQSSNPVTRTLNNANANNRPAQYQPVRPNTATSTMQPQRIIQRAVANPQARQPQQVAGQRPVMSQQNRNLQPTRPVQQRPNQPARLVQPVRPIQSSNQTTNQPVRPVRRCVRCGKVLAPNEKYCNNCGQRTE